LFYAEQNIKQIISVGKRESDREIYIGSSRATFNHHHTTENSIIYKNQITKQSRVLILNPSKTQNTLKNTVSKNNI